MTDTKVWSPKSYEDIHVVSTEHEVLAWLKPQRAEKVLDLGCGIGDLTKQIADAGAWVEGIDASTDMIDEAKRRYPEIPFAVEDARYFTRSVRYDAVFSCAVLHWISEADQVLRQVHSIIRDNGRFVAQLAGTGNISRILHVIEQVLQQVNISWRDRNTLYFPSMGEYTSRLEKAGFTVRKAIQFNQPTPLVGGEQGLRNWFSVTMAHFFDGLPEQKKEELYQEVEHRLRPYLYNPDTQEWHVDYVALRFHAEKTT